VIKDQTAVVVVLVDLFIKTCGLWTWTLGVWSVENGHENSCYYTGKDRNERTFISN